MFRDLIDQNEAVAEARGHDHYGLVEVEEQLPQFEFPTMIYNYYTVWMGITGHLFSPT